MVSLIDIVPQTRTIQTSVGEIELRGIGLRQFAVLLMQFPELRKLTMEGVLAFDVVALLHQAPDTVGEIIATAARQPEAADNIADIMNFDDLADCLLAIRDLTIPGGPGPFVQKLRRLVGDDPIAAPNGRDADTSMQPLPSN